MCTHVHTCVHTLCMYTTPISRLTTKHKSTPCAFEENKNIPLNPSYKTHRVSSDGTRTNSIISNISHQGLLNTYVRLALFLTSVIKDCGLDRVK